MNSSIDIDRLLGEVRAKELRARKRALIYSIIPVAVAAVLVIWTSRELSHAWAEVKNARGEVEVLMGQVKALKEQADSVNRQLRDDADMLVGIATATRQIESLIESKESYLRTIDEARFLIDIRMKFDAINKELLKLSQTFPAIRTVTDSRRWVAVVKSSRDLKELRGSAQTWVNEYGASKIAIYRTPNGFYTLAVLGDGTFTEAYRLTVALIKSGRARDAYFAEASDWSPNLM